MNFRLLRPAASTDGSHPASVTFSRKTASTASDILPLADFTCVLLAAYFSRWVFSAQLGSMQLQADNGADLERLMWAAVCLAPFVLYMPQFADRAVAADYTRLTSGFLRRFSILAAVLASFAFAGRWFAQLPLAWLGLWISISLLATGLSRVALAASLRRMALAGSWATPMPGSDPLVGNVLPVRLIADRPIRLWNAVLKSGFDFLVTLIGTILLLPLLALIAVSIRIDSPGPVLFRQRRHGYNNREFDIFKFRTMRVALTGTDSALQQTLHGDDRITRVGRFLRRWSLDELPQLFNVLAGDMSLVGPRPHAVNMRTEEQFGHEISYCYRHRHRVRPGITGWAQVNGSRGATDTAEKLRLRVELDLYYVDHWSLMFDLQILARTYKAVVQGTNAF